VFVYVSISLEIMPSGVSHKKYERKMGKIIFNHKFSSLDLVIEFHNFKNKVLTS
jgi:hypothetical protein